jgi:hypothetical protein
VDRNFLSVARPGNTTVGPRFNGSAPVLVPDSPGGTLTAISQRSLSNALQLLQAELVFGSDNQPPIGMLVTQHGKWDVASVQILRNPDELLGTCQQLPHPLSFPAFPLEPKLGFLDKQATCEVVTQRQFRDAASLQGLRIPERVPGTCQQLPHQQLFVAIFWPHSVPGPLQNAPHHAAPPGEVGASLAVNHQAQHITYSRYALVLTMAAKPHGSIQQVIDPATISPDDGYVPNGGARLEKHPLNSEMQHSMCQSCGGLVLVTDCSCVEYSNDCYSNVKSSQKRRPGMLSFPTSTLAHAW